MNEVRVLLPVYNGEKFLRTQLKSIQSQSHSNFIVSVLDDESSDSSRKIVLGLEDERFQLRAREHLGIFQNLRLALKMEANFSFPFYALADQDDIWSEKLLESGLDLLKKQQNVASMVFPTYLQIDTNSRIGDIDLNPSTLNHSNSLITNPFKGSGAMFNRELLDLYLEYFDLFDGIYVDDALYFLASQFGSVFLNPSSSLKYRIHNENSVGIPKFGHSMKRRLEYKIRRKIVHRSVFKIRTEKSLPYCNMCYSLRIKNIYQRLLFVKHLDSHASVRLRLLQFALLLGLL
jgi:rhamnosyltransferase